MTPSSLRLSESCVSRIISDVGEQLRGSVDLDGVMAFRLVRPAANVLRDPAVDDMPEIRLYVDTLTIENPSSQRLDLAGSLLLSAYIYVREDPSDIEPRDFQASRQALVELALDRLALPTDPMTGELLEKEGYPNDVAAYIGADGFIPPRWWWFDPDTPVTIEHTNTFKRFQNDLLPLAPGFFASRFDLMIRFYRTRI